MESELITSTFQVLSSFLILILVIVIAIYIAIGIFLNKFNKLVYGKGTPMAFIPLVNIYLLGKLTISKPVGLILVFVPILTGTLTTNINGEENTYSLFPADISSKINLVVSIVTLGLLIYAIFLYFKLKKEKENGTNISKEEKRPLETQNKDIINNIIHENKESNRINSYNENMNNNINTNNTVPISNINNYNVDKTPKDKAEPLNVNNNVYSNDEPSELMKQYQNHNSKQ